ncbi:MAG TPA: AAA family ATPase [Polyangia bacterium]|nr:AAA family ATPase [Polyangia bacterium]
MAAARKPIAAPARGVALHPAGTARALFQAGAEGEKEEALPRVLWEQLRARDVSPATLLAAWEACRWVTAPLAERRALACLLVALGEAFEAGSAFLSLSADARDDDGLAPWLARLGLGEADRRATSELAAALVAGRASASVADLFGAPNARRPFVLDGDRLFPDALSTVETRLAALLAARLRAPAQSPAAGEDPALNALSPEQRAAVDACLTRPLTLVTGGPGTGKTSIIVTVLRALARAGVAPDRIAIAAPTGRAAQRIDESIQAAGLTFPDGAPAPTVSTLHRLLGVRPARQPTLDADPPEFHAGWRLPHQVVVVDEASMIDLFMMTDLLSALADDARLILLGDADQLPAVRLGAVFRDLCAVLPDRTCRLTRSFRMDPADPAGAAILRVAQALGHSAGETAPFPLGSPAAALTFQGVEHVERAALPALLRRWYDEVLGGQAGVASLATTTFQAAADGTLTDDPSGALAAVLARHAAARLLCLTRVADSVTGTAAVNTLLHQFMARALARRSSASDEGDGLLPGEPVAVLRNDYDRQLWNGDQGVVVAMADAAGRTSLGVAFARSGRIVLHPLDEVADNVELAFALTVHKAQGSEYDRIVVLLPSTDGPLLSREILYTALTRARRGVVIAGDSALFSLGARRPVRRASGLADKLRARD